MANFTTVSSGFAHLSMSLAEDAHQAGEDKKASMFIELARAIFDLNENMVARENREQVVLNQKNRRRVSKAVTAALIPVRLNIDTRPVSGSD